MKKDKAIVKAPSPKPQIRERPVRLKLRRIHAGHAKAYPPDGDSKLWWSRLQVALGTTSSDFVNGALAQLMAAARLPGGGISPVAMNAALAMIEGQRPKDEVETAIVMQMACAHGAAMMLLARFGGGGGGDRRVQALAHATARIINAFNQSAETLRRRKQGGSQYMRIDHVHVTEGGQAIIGNVLPPPANQTITGGEPNEAPEIIDAAQGNGLAEE
jgi:hypothetical protein